MERFWIAPNPPKEFPRDPVSKGPTLVLEGGRYQFLLFPAQAMTRWGGPLDVEVTVVVPGVIFILCRGERSSRLHRSHRAP